MCTLDCLFAVRANRDYSDRRFEFLLEEFDIVDKFLRELGFALHLCHIGLPAGKRHIDRLDFFVVDCIGEIACDCSVDVVGGAGFDFVEPVEDIALHHDELCHTVDHNGITKGHKINPSAAAFTACHCAVLMAEGADSLACLVKQFGRERTAADACAVGFEDAEHFADLAGSDTETGACTCADCVA